MNTTEVDATEISLATIERCFRGAVPAVLATADADGVPNVTYLSRAHPVDDHRIALSNQFMSKTSRNVASNPRASLLLIDPVDYTEYRLALVYERTERRGPVFERLRADIDDLAALTGMQDVFCLRAADVYRVVEIVPLAPNPLASAIDLRAMPPREPARDLAALAELIRTVGRAPHLDVALDLALDGLARSFGYEHSYLLLVDERGDRLFTIASRGYDDDSLGAEVAFGDGQVGAAAARCEPISIGGVRQLAKYSRSVRRQYEAAGVNPGREQPLPGIPDVDSRLAVPAMSGGQLIGVLVVESARSAAFGQADEQLLSVVANALAGAVELERERPEAAPATSTAAAPPAAADPGGAATSTSTIRYFTIDGSTFVDGDYLIKGVAGRILWSLLDQHAGSGRTEFTNKELRLDPSLDLPGYKDNLESRLLLLRRRLDERRTPFRIVRTGRGRFRLDVTAPLLLECVDDRT